MSPSKTLVVGASGVVGTIITRLLAENREFPIALSRKPRAAVGIDWKRGDLHEVGACQIPPFETLMCTADARLLAEAIPHLIRSELKRVVFFTSTSILTKIDSEVESERRHIREWAAAERRIIEICEQRNVEWTALRPTLVYSEGRDGNITPLARLIKRYGFMPVVGRAQGLRQPVHAEDVAAAAVAAAKQPAAANKIYVLSGSETITYREMVGRIFDGLHKRRRIVPLPLSLWKAAFSVARPLFPEANVAWGTRMQTDLAFDASEAVRDLGWRPRPFRPKFEQLS